MIDIGKAKRAIGEEKLSGWLFFNLHHRDSLSDRILEIPNKIHNSRPWLYLIRRESEPAIVVHGVEAGALDHLPGEKMVYSSRSSFLEILRELARAEEVTAAQFSSQVPFISFLDHGTARVLSECGFNLTSSDKLVQRFLGLLDKSAIESHEMAATKLYAIVEEIWDRIRNSMKKNSLLSEGEVQQWILDLFQRAGLYSDFPPLVAVGKNTCDPHYLLREEGDKLEAAAVLQLDIWARLKGQNSVYGDISWGGVLARSVPEEVAAVFDTLVAARDLAVAFIAQAFKNKKPVSGFEVDQRVRSLITERGYGEFLLHRTGHAIDTEVHGYGVNLDSVEFPDSRLILEGSCFSIEPGIYTADFGLRTEINVYIKNSKVVISGGTPQQRLLTLS